MQSDIQNVDRKWSSMETAPKDNTRLLLWDGHYTCIGSWYNEEWIDDSYESVDAKLWMPLPVPLIVDHDSITITDSFSGDVSSLKRGHRNEENVLAVLKNDPHVSTWAMSEFTWLREAIENLERRGLILAKPRPYPWHRYTLTDAGNEMLQMLRENAIRRIDPR